MKVTISFRFWILSTMLLIGSCSTFSKKKRAEGPKDTLMSKDLSNPGAVVPTTTLSFLWPVQDLPKIVSFFGWRKKVGRRARGERMHEGIDIKGVLGQKIFASSDGRVIDVAWVRGYGRTVIIYHGGGWSTLYAHLSKYKTRKGKEVKAGEVIALMGRTGVAEAVHLHFEVRKGADPLDPLLFLPSREVERYAPKQAGEDLEAI